MYNEINAAATRTGCPEARSFAWWMSFLGDRVRSGSELFDAINKAAKDTGCPKGTPAMSWIYVQATDIKKLKEELRELRALQS